MPSLRPAGFATRTARGMSCPSWGMWAGDVGLRGRWGVLCHGVMGRMGLEGKAWRFKLGCCIKERNTLHAVGLRWGGRKKEPPHSYSCSEIGRASCRERV